MSQMELRDGKKLKRSSNEEPSLSEQSIDKVPDSDAATIEDLSPELLVKIFSHCIQMQGHVNFARNVVPVCKTWWNLSWTPSLWKNIHVQDSKSSLSFSKGALKYTLTLEASYSCACDTDEELNSLERDRLLGVLPHIRNVKYFEINNKNIDVNTMATVAKYCPNLEHLHMRLVSRVGFGLITLEELNPILTTCGPKLKHLDFDCCEVRDSKQLITEIAAKCTSLEILRWNNGCGFSKIPIDELVVGCPRLSKMILSKCELVGGNDCFGFKDLTVFKATYCRCGKLDVCSFLRNSENLDHLELIDNDDLIFNNPSKIPSNKVRYLKLHLKDVSLEALEHAVNKWKRTLLHLQILGCEYNITSALKILLDSNPCLKLEALCVRKKRVDLNFLKELIKECETLEKLEFYNFTKPYDNVKPYGSRKEVVKFGDSL